MHRHDGLQYEGSRREFLELVAQFDAPAFVRRARRVEELRDQVLSQCRRDRDELLQMPKMRLAMVGALIDCHWSSLHAFLPARQAAEYLGTLHDDWKPELRGPVAPTQSPRKIREALRDLAASFVYFNGRWAQFVRTVDLSGINKAREDYNNYYVCEKACAFQSERIGNIGFRRLLPFTVADVTSELPFLEVPSIA